MSKSRTRNQTRRRRRRSNKTRRHRKGGMGAIGKVLHDALPSLVLFEALRHTKKKKGGRKSRRHNKDS